MSANAQPLILGGLGILAHEGIIHGIAGTEDLLVRVALVVIPDPGAASREDCPDRKTKPHLSRFEDASLGIDKGDTDPVEQEAIGDLGGRQVAMEPLKSVYVVEGCLA
ncbi:hypothetical protein [Acidiferrobacter sp.]|jgi:hypothetical protein|uniref:hypothetical protein n=1 Tax=Acidiferrobacter sp. TaxID=1872107 RepID=UPI0026108AED|nr:hypothetical protein [Acidiferrobacter sp.]